MTNIGISFHMCKSKITYSHNLRDRRLHIYEVQFPSMPLSHSAAHFYEVNGTMCFAHNQVFDLT